jgi:hypothetical protein
MSLVSIVKCAAILSLVIILEMIWVISASRSGGVSGGVFSLAVRIVAATIAIYVFLFSIIAARVMAPLFYQL